MRYFFKLCILYKIEVDHALRSDFAKKQSIDEQEKYTSPRKTFS